MYSYWPLPLLSLALNFSPLLSIFMKSSSHTSNTGSSISWKMVRLRGDYTTPGEWRSVWYPWSPPSKERLQNILEGKGLLVRAQLSITLQI